MTAVPGGGADKLGNRYEHWWTAIRVADVLEGRASRIRLEPPGQAGVGIEFEVQEGDTTWGEQTKDAPARGSWTLKRLETEGVLAAIQIQASLGRSFRLVVSTAATDLETLSTRARESASIEEFRSSLNEPHRAAFQNLIELYGCSPDDGLAILRTVHVEHHSASSLRRLVSSTYRRLVAGDPDLAVAELRRFCEDNLHHSVTGLQVWAHLDSVGLPRRLLAGDANTLAELHATVDRHQRRVESSAPIAGIVARNEVETVLDGLRSDAEQQVVLVDGHAGFGKSTLISQVATELEGEGWFVAVARMDSLEATTNTSNKLGVAIGLSESPAVLLANVADGSPALLVIDQLDAVSAYSGRMPDVYDVVPELLNELAGAANVRVLLAARTVDIEADPRLRQLVNNSERVQRVTIGRLEVDQVEQLLRDGDMTVPESETTIELLRTPLHLSVFSRLSESARELSYRTLPELYARYTEELRRQVEQGVGTLSWSEITGTLVTFMSDNEVLAAPIATLDPMPQLEVGALVSTGVLVRDDQRVSFFHESYFDFLFARAFVASGASLREFLADSGQFLFRRAQTRQVLEYMAATDRDGFRNVVAELLGAGDIRRHLKEIVISVLNGLDATSEDWAVVEEIAWDKAPLGRKLLQLLTRPSWFDAADEMERWPEWLEDPELVDEAFHKLAFAARERPKRVAEIVQPHIGESEDWRLRLRFLIQWSLTPELTDLAVQLALRGDLDDARGPIAINSDFWSIVYGLNQESPESAARLAGAHLARGLERATADGVNDPFTSHIATDSSGGGAGLIIEIAEAAPQTYLREVLPFVIKVAVADQFDREELLPGGRRWGFRHVGDLHGVDDGVFVGTEKALGLLARESPDLCMEFVAELRHAESDELRFLACRTITLLDDADDAIEWMLSDERNFSLGWADSPRWASRELIEAHSPTCSDELLASLEESLLAYEAGWESGRSRGLSQYELLGGIDRARLSAAGLRRMGELERRFGVAPTRVPQSIEAHWVGSPIPDENAEHMSDSDWLRALRKHSTDDTDWSGPVPVGGARELAQVLGRRAKAEPQRFARLGLALDSEIPAAALDQIISNVSGSADVKLFTELCLHAANLHGSEVGRTICSAVRDLDEVDEGLVSLIERYASDADPEDESARTDARSGQFFYNGDLLFAGLNTTRGQAALAAASVLFRSDAFGDRMLAVLDQLVEDPILAVRVCAAEGVVACFNHDDRLALDFAERLLQTHPDVLDARTSERLLIYAMIRSPERFLGTIDTAIGSSDALANRCGRVLAVAQVRDLDVGGRIDALAQLPEPARIGAAEVYAVNIDSSLDELAECFRDDSDEVRSTASRAMRKLDRISVDQLEPLIQAFVESPAFAENCDDLLDSLADLRTLLPDTTIAVCERVVEIASDDLGDITTGRSLMSKDLVSIALRLYRQGNPELRSRCLDLIDRLVDTNAFGLEKALDSER